MNTVPAKEWTKRYEDLRGYVLEDSSHRKRSWGRTLLIQRGMVAWMQAWASCTWEAEQERPFREEAPSGAELSVKLREPIVAVLVDMALRNCQEATA